jgi:hypothetical protein
MPGTASTEALSGIIISMRIELLQKLTVVSSYVFEEMTDDKTETELARDFWKYLRTKILDDMTRKIRVSEFVEDYIRKIPAAEFDLKYGTKIGNVLKSRAQLDFVAQCVSMLLHYSSYGSKIIDWS